MVTLNRSTGADESVALDFPSRFARRHLVTKSLMCGLRYLRKPFMTPVVLLVLTPTVVAGSGLTSEASRKQDRSIGNKYWFVALFILAAIVAVYFFCRRVGRVIVLSAVLISFFHPIWHFGRVGSPDCGQHFAENAPYVTLSLGALFLAQLALWLLRRRVPAAAHK